MLFDQCRINEYNAFRPHISLANKIPDEVHKHTRKKLDFSIYECVR